MNTMKNRSNEFNISRIIAKHFLGTCSPAEEDSLDKWMNEKPDNQLLFQRITDQKELSKKLNTYQSFDTEAAFEKFRTNLEKSKRIHVLYSVLRYAAIFLLPIIAGGLVFWYLNLEPAVISQKQAIVNISPGKSKALLILADGSSIDLESKGLNTIKEKDGTQIINNSKSISYLSSNAGKPLQAAVINKLIIPRGGEYQLTLADGTKVWLNSETRLQYPTRFTGSKREVILSGEAFFEVTKDPGKPFIVKVEHMDVKVFGTSFNVKAYPDEKGTETTLVEGKVQLTTDLPEYKTKEVFLAPGENVNMSATSSSFTKKKVDANIYTSWINGEFVFQNDNLEEVLTRLSRWYDFQFSFARPELKHFHFTGTLKRHEDISQIIDHIEYTSGLKISIKESTIYIH